MAKIVDESILGELFVSSMGWKVSQWISNIYVDELLKESNNSTIGTDRDTNEIN